MKEDASTGAGCQHWRRMWTSGDRRMNTHTHAHTHLHAPTCTSSGSNLSSSTEINQSRLAEKQLGRQRPQLSRHTRSPSSCFVREILPLRFLRQDRHAERFPL